MLHRIRQQCVNNTVCQHRSLSTVNYKKECLICGRARTTKRDRSLLLISTLDRQKAVWDNAKELGDEYMLHMICRSDKKCHEMVANNFQYHSVCINAYMMTRRIRSQEKACLITHTSPYMILTQLVSHPDDPLFKDGVIFLVTFLSDGFAKFLETHGVDNVHPY